MSEETEVDLNEHEDFYASHEKLSPVSSDASVKPNLMIEENDSDLLSLDADVPTPQILLDNGFDEEAKTAGSVEESEMTTEAMPADEAVESETATEVFDILAAPVLPKLDRENRAVLQMQSPNRLHFYWSIKNNPYQTLNRVFGKNVGNYQIVLKLVNQKFDSEEIFAAEAEGSYWFDVDSNSTYRVELGFYAPNRPFIRILHSNTIETPRKSPSPRRDLLPAFNVSARQFAEVLERSGFRQDAIEVAFAGDDAQSADAATQRTFAQITGKTKFADSEPNETRYALLALAAGASIDELRGGLNPSLAAVLQAERNKLSAEEIRRSLEANFGALADEFIEEETILSSRIVGASLLNFPRTIRRRNLPRKISSISSFSKI